MENRNATNVPTDLLEVCAELVKTMGHELRQDRSMYREEIEQLHELYKTVHSRQVKTIYWLVLILGGALFGTLRQLWLLP